MRNGAEATNRAVSRIRARSAATSRRAARRAASLRQREEDALIASARTDAEAVARSRSTLLSELSHDLRNPVSVLSLNLQVLERAAGAEERARRPLEVIRRVSDELTQMLDTTSEAARIDRGDLTLQLGHHPIAAMIDDALRPSRRNAQLKELNLNITAAPDLPPVLCDRDRVVRALAGLLARAVRVSHKRATVTVHAEPDGDGVRLTVADEGTSIPEGAAAFDPPDDKEQRMALGASFVLDLFVARGVIESQGGAITAAPRAPRGTAFVITLPGTLG